MMKTKQLLIVLMVMTASLSHAHFVDVWPAWEHPRSGVTQASQVYSATVERVNIASYYVTGVPAPTPPSFYRSERALLVSYKASMKKQLTAFSCDTRTPSEIVDWWNEYSYTASLFGATTNWTLVTFCEANSIPTNYFDYTPWRCLNGLGPFTTDASVGHAHGWTNSYTTKGGPYLPSGRSTWYTTDYGWESMRTITNLNKMILVKQWSSSPKSLYEKYSNQYSGQQQYPTNWSETIDVALASPVSLAPAGNNFTYGLRLSNSSTTAYVARVTWNGVTNIVTEKSPTAANLSVMFKTRLPNEGGAYKVYDPWLSGYNRLGSIPGGIYEIYGWQLHTNVITSSTSSTTTYTYRIGSTRDEQSWDTPTETVPLRVRGYTIDFVSSSYILHMYDWTGRFDY